MKGSYILLIQLPEEQTIAIGRRQTWCFPGGFYAYVGSAMGGLKPRLRRHLGDHKRLHWHIDYLLQKASIESILLCETNDRAECAIARALSHQFNSIPGFGSSDCQCRSHLFSASDEMKTSIMTALELLAIPPRLAIINQSNIRLSGNLSP